MNYSLRKPDSNLGVGRAKTRLGSEQAARRRSSLLTPDGAFFSRGASPVCKPKLVFPPPFLQVIAVRKDDSQTHSATLTETFTL